MLKRVKLSSIHANPYRSFDTYKLVPEKLASLKESYDATGFWSETLVARPRKGGGVELAFGHHRWQAALKHKNYGANKMVEITVKEVSNDDMLKMMSRENNEVFDANAQMDIELVKSAIEAHAKGEVHLPAVEKKTRNAKGLNASDYFQSAENSESFTAKGLAEYLGQPQWRVNEALGHLRQIKENLTDISDYEGLTPAQAQEMKTEINRAAAQHGKQVGRKVAKAVGKAVREKKASTNSNKRNPGSSKQTVSQVANKVISKATGTDTPLHKFARQFDDCADKMKAADVALHRLMRKLEELDITSIEGTNAYQFNIKMDDLANKIKAFKKAHRFKPTPEAKKLRVIEGGAA